MRYIKADTILPPELIRNIQQYADGVTIYIPRKEENRHHWGTDTGYRAELSARNSKIRQAYGQGVSVGELASEFHLSEKSIRRILKNS